MKTIKIWMISLLMIVGLTSMINAAEPEAGNSEVSVSLADVSFGQSTRLKVILRDRYFDDLTNIPDAADEMVHFESIDGSAVALTTTLVAHIGNKYIYDITSADGTREQNVNISVGGIYRGVQWQFPTIRTVKFRDGTPPVNNYPIDSSKSTIIAADEQVVADGADSTTITVTLRDIRNNPVREATLVPSQSYNGSATESIMGDVVEHANGIYTFSVRSNTVEQVTYSVVATATYGDNNSQTSTETIAQQDNEATVSFVPRGLPNGVRIDAGEVKYVVSVYDQDYAPYHKQFGPGTYDRPVDADGLNDGTTIDIQGTLTTAGEVVELKYHSSVSVQLPAYTAAYNVPAVHTEDGQARRVVFSYPAQYLHSGNGVVRGTIRSISANLKAKKLDINAAIGDGSDRIMINASNNLSKSVYGVMLAEFDMAVNSNGDTGEVQLRIMVGIPDRRFGESGHNFLYLPKQSSGKTWLNNNLEADYANLDSSYFNLAQQATNKLDRHAFGSYFSTTTSSDICPRGYELPTGADLESERNSWGGYYSRNSTGAYNSPLKLTAAGQWYTLGYPGYQRQYVGWGRYLSSSKKYGAYTNTLVYHSCAANMQYLADHCVIYLKYSARCVKK